MKQILFAALAVAMLAGYAAPSFAGQGGEPNSNSDGANGGKAHDGHGQGQGEGANCDPQSSRGNDS